MSMKALLIISALSSVGNHTVPMPTFEDCLAARVQIAKQDPDTKTLCIPAADETEKMKSFFKVFMSLVGEIKKLEKEYGTPTTGDSDLKCKDCPR